MSISPAEDAFFSTFPSSFLTIHVVQHLDGADAPSSKDERDEFTWTEEEETRIRHKIDWHTVPWVTVLYMFCVS